MGWARRDQAASAACLQVVEANAPARRLYERMGFSAPLYGYHYRLKEAPAAPVPLTRD
jgi:ribosomal protein S18 acetylase RimI-like enzyme